MLSSTLVRLASSAAMLGGVVWLDAIALYGLQPEDPPGTWCQGWFLS